MKTTFEELSTKYPIQNVTPYGECIVVPGAEFDPDWEAYLGDQGCRCIMTDLDGKPVTLVQRKNHSGQGEKIVYENKGTKDARKMEKAENKTATTKLKGCQKGPSWSVEEEEQLLKRMDELSGPIERRARKLEPEFKGRSACSIWQKYKKLLRAKRAKHVSTPASAQIIQKDSGPRPIVKPVTSSPAPVENPMVTLLTEIRDLLTPEAFDFDYHCPECNEHGSVCNSEKVWLSCPVCGAPLIIWNVEAAVHA